MTADGRRDAVVDKYVAELSAATGIPEDGQPHQVRRQGAGVAVNGRRVMVLRKNVPWTREQMCEAISALGMTGRNGKPVEMKPDFLGKIEIGARRPSVEKFDAMCRVLGVPAAVLSAEDSPVPDEADDGDFRLAPDDQEHEDRVAGNKLLIEFAKAHGLKYRGHRTYYGKPLRTAYQARLDLARAELSGDVKAVRAARQAYEAALAAAPRADDGSDLADAS